MNKARTPLYFYVSPKFLTRVAKEQERGICGTAFKWYGKEVTVAFREYEDLYDVKDSRGRHVLSFTHVHSKRPNEFEVSYIAQRYRFEAIDGVPVRMVGDAAK
jgi:hypothetical protein